MSAQTNTELIGELREAVAILGFRADTTQENIEDLRRVGEEIKDQRERLTKLEVKLEQLDKQRGEEHGRSWAIKLAFLSALIGSAFTLLTQPLSRYVPIK